MNFFKKHKLIILILALAGFLRVFRITQVPPSLNWDEASLGYNAYSILKTGKDEFGNFLPINLRSFEDYKPALYAYISIPSIALLDLNAFSVRLPSALFGTLTVLLIYLITKEILKPLSSQKSLNSQNPKTLSLISAFLLTISPWHLQFSRAAFEANLGLFWFCLASWLLLVFLENKNYKPLVLSGLSYLLAMYGYHSLRLIVPIFLILVFLVFKKKFIKNWKPLLVSLLISGFLSIPLIWGFFNNGGQARFSSVGFISQQNLLNKSIQYIQADLKRSSLLIWIHNRRFVYLKTFLNNYLSHFNPNFLFINGDLSPRHHISSHGMLYLFQLPLVLWGAFCLAKIPKKSYFLWLWLIASPLASALTIATPHAIRANLMVIPLTILSAIGLWRSYIHLRSKKILLAASGLLLAFFITRYLLQYHLIYPKNTAHDWQYGFSKVVDYLKNHNQENLPVVVSFSDHTFDQPHIFFMFYLKVDPQEYQEKWAHQPFNRFYRSFDNYQFREVIWEKDQNLKDVYIVTNTWGMPSNPRGLVNEISFPNGEVAFKIIRL